MQERGYSPLADGDDDAPYSKGEAERESRKSRRYHDKSTRFRGDVDGRSRSRGYGKESRRDRMEDNVDGDQPNDTQHRQQVESRMDIRFVFLFLL